MPPVNVKIFSSVANALWESAKKQSPNETGGVLVGTRAFTGYIWEFNILGAMGVGDFTEFQGTYIATPARFECKDRVSWATLASKAIEAYGMNYIGDWHSHPNSNLGVLSSVDFSMLVEQFFLGQFDPFPPLHILVYWAVSNQEPTLKANILLNSKYVIVVEPEIITR